MAPDPAASKAAVGNQGRSRRRPVSNPTRRMESRASNNRLSNPAAAARLDHHHRKAAAKAAK
jgi:hypothetical protein